MIPPRIIRCVPEVVPAEWEHFGVMWREQHPTWDHVEYRDPIDPAAFPLLGHLFETCVHGAQVAGLVRLESVYTLGGIYVDADFEPLQSIEPLLQYECFIGTEDGIHLTDAMFGAEAGHPGVRAAIDEVAMMDMSIGPQATGPLLTTRTMRRDDVMVLPIKWLYPYLYTEKHRRHEDFRSTTPEALCAHHWSFSWSKWQEER